MTGSTPPCHISTYLVAKPQPNGLSHGSAISSVNEAPYDSLWQGGRVNRLRACFWHVSITRQQLAEGLKNRIVPLAPRPNLIDMSRTLSKDVVGGTGG